MRSRWASWFLLRQLVGRDVASRYAGSFLGVLWSFVQPLWQLVLYSFVFSTVMKISLTGERTERFWVFLFCGLLPWMALSEGLQRGTTAVTDNATLVKKLRFPAEILVLTVVAGGWVHAMIAGAVFAVVLAVLGILAPASLGWLALAIPLQLALTAGLALGLAAAQVYLRDVAQLVGILVGIWFYLTPILYPLRLVPEGYRSVIALNPGSGLVGLYRAALLGGAPPPVAGVASLAIAAAAALGLGWVAFRRLSPGFADEL